VRVLTVRPPYSDAIANLGKDVENRSWRTDYRGPIAIHAGRRVDRAGIRIVERRYGLRGALPERLYGGGVVAIADLVDVHPAADCWEQLDNGDWVMCSAWAEQTGYHWVLQNVRPLEQPFGLQGSLGLRVLPADFEREILARVAA
jgi:hypothetical protein